MSGGTICLDLDGTLTTCEPRQSAVLRAALVAAAASADIAKVWRLKRDGATTENALQKLGLAPELAAQVTTMWRQMIEQPVWLRLDSPFPEALSTLSLMRLDFELIVITARSRPEWVDHQIRGMGLREFFSQVEVVPPGRQHSAKADVLKTVAPIAFFGDTEMDARAAADSKTPFYGVSSGQRSAAFLNDKCGIEVSLNLAEAWEKFRETEAAR